MNHRQRPVLAILLIATLAAGVSGCFNPFRPLVSGLTSFSKPAPAPTGPREVVELFKWCWENRDISKYREIFTDDYRFEFAITDSAGNPYRNSPWTREDEVTSAEHLFVGGGAGEPVASTITLIFDGDLQDQPDFRPGKTDTVHRQIQIANLTLTITKSDGNAVRVTGGALFYLVRGDSAVIPQELKDRGFKSDSTRWYIERWEDQTNVGAGAASVAPARGAGLSATLPDPPLLTERMTWGQVKRVWLGR